ncbi:MAG TPA: FGGY-family carbohydrate kinase, partial [Clostridia bacterium]|nr:FGGY-family carbohydrate kinase [Clostridia bacterium]
VWVSMFADTINLPIEVVSVRELGTLGCAMAAGIAAGVYTDYKQAAQRMVKISKRIEPNPENHKIYRRKFEKYKKIVQALASLYY